MCKLLRFSATYLTLGKSSRQCRKQLHIGLWKIAYLAELKAFEETWNGSEIANG
jgi:hypothetical protein